MLGAHVRFLIVLTDPARQNYITIQDKTVQSNVLGFFPMAALAVCLREVRKKLCL